MTQETITLQDIFTTAEEDLLERVADENESRYVGDLIAEIADTSVPMYNGTLLELASKEHELALAEPECGPAFDGSPTPINIIAANIYEAISEHLWSHWELNLKGTSVCDECEAIHWPDDLFNTEEDESGEWVVCPSCGEPACREISVRD